MTVSESKRLLLKRLYFERNILITQKKAKLDWGWQTTTDPLITAKLMQVLHSRGHETAWLVTLGPNYRA